MALALPVASSQNTRYPRQSGDSDPYLSPIRAKVEEAVSGITTGHSIISDKDWYQRFKDSKSLMEEISQGRASPATIQKLVNRASLECQLIRDRIVCMTIARSAANILDGKPLNRRNQSIAVRASARLHHLGACEELATIAACALRQEKIPVSVLKLAAQQNDPYSFGHCILIIGDEKSVVQQMEASCQKNSSIQTFFCCLETSPIAKTVYYIDPLLNEGGPAGRNFLLSESFKYLSSFSCFNLVTMSPYDFRSSLEDEETDIQCVVTRAQEEQTTSTFAFLTKDQEEIDRREERLKMFQAILRPT